MKNDERAQFLASTRGESNGLDGHLVTAKSGLLLGLLPVAGYLFAFTAFGSSKLPWMIALAIDILCPVALYAHYYLNRQTRRLVWVGWAEVVGFLPMWMLLGSHWLFYLGFAPMPTPVRVTALMCCLSVTGCWTWLTWRAFDREAAKEGLIKTLFLEEQMRVCYPRSSDLVAGAVPGPRLSITIPGVFLSMFASAVLAYTIVSAHGANAGGGPHGVFILLSVLSVPATCWIITNLFARNVFFHIYLPLKIERMTGKKVIFDV